MSTADTGTARTDAAQARPRAASLEVDPSLEAEFEKATAYALTDDDIERGEVVGVCRILRVLTEPKAARDLGSTRRWSRPTTPTTTTSASTPFVAPSTLEGREGYWDGVEVGDALPAMVKAPLPVTEIIAFHAGGYGFVPYGLRASRVAPRAASGSRPSTSGTSRGSGTSLSACTGPRSGPGRSVTRRPTTTG